MNTNQSRSSVRLKRIGPERSTLPDLTAWDIAKTVFSDSASHASFVRPNQNHKPFHANDDTFQNKTDVDFALQFGAWLSGIAGNIEKAL
ncbi:hypothetical protein PITC_001830 [Penicillium italicum]|uniref:Uncharacterized protein n=1 Tax=Penicillium italicum TaxID=40296 RepID=A0A0A2L5S8_PENIT|nr:hypothetical protein PITC_001830 [Penicillium italicum]